MQKESKRRLAMKVMLELDTDPKDPLLIGVIGAGRLGSYLVELILQHIPIFPEELKISTRRPETLSK